MLKKVLTPCVLVFGLTLILCALPISAQDVAAGLDLFESQEGTRAEFRDDPLPQGFFPGCDEKFAGEIPLVGRPIVADQPLGTTDSILHRLDDVQGGNGKSALVIEALCMQNTAWTDPCGGEWDVWVRLDKDQEVTELNMWSDGSKGGGFDTVVSVRVAISFSQGDKVLGPVGDSVELVTENAAWNYDVAPGGVVAKGPLKIDADCDGVIDTALSVGSSNFHVAQALHVIDHAKHPVYAAVQSFVVPSTTIPVPTH
ncbi:MAG: hypothetical protein GY856_28500 [bacterium]|nr:hypothetical protein [bacterium]